MLCTGGDRKIKVIVILEQKLSVITYWTLSGVQVVEPCHFIIKNPIGKITLFKCSYCSVCIRLCVVDSTGDIGRAVS